MTLYHLDPRDAEERDCPCAGVCPDERHESPCPADCAACIEECEPCPDCHGTGRLPAREPEVEIGIESHKLRGVGYY